MKPTFDPIKFEVIRNALIEATEEMTIALRRSAYSTNIKDPRRFSCAFFDSELQPVAQSFTQPVHLGSLSQSVPRVIREYGPENWVRAMRFFPMTPISVAFTSTTLPLSHRYITRTSFSATSPILPIMWMSAAAHPPASVPSAKFFRRESLSRL